MARHVKIQRVSCRSPADSCQHGSVRQRNAADQPRRGDAALVPRLRDERDRRARAARCARRPEAGASPRAVRDARGQQRLEPALREVRAHRRRGDGQVPPARRQRPSTTRWCAWRRTSRCAIRWSTARATSARSTATAPRRCATPSAACEKIAGEMLADIDKETVDFQPNYDGKELEPTVLPARIPNLLINGSAGIAVGMATNIPPHNLGEIVDACQVLLRNPETTHRRTDRARAGARLPHRRHHLRRAGRARGLSHRPRARRDARDDALRGDRPRQPQRDHRRRAAVPGEQARCCSSASPNWSTRRRSRASRTSATSPTSRACAW